MDRNLEPDDILYCPICDGGYIQSLSRSPKVCFECDEPLVDYEVYLERKEAHND